MSLGGGVTDTLMGVVFVELAERLIRWKGRRLWCGNDTESPYQFCSPGCYLGYGRSQRGRNSS
jgi:hypothetical protein